MVKPIPMEVMQVSSERARVEAVGLLTGRGVNSERRELHERVLGRRIRGGSGVGIAGAEVCQSCGAIEPFAGLAAAMLKHRKDDYLCSACLRALSGADAGAYGSVELGRVEEEMAERPRRFCEVCTGEVSSNTAARIRRRGLLCAECQAELERLDSDLEGLLCELSRVRYLELRHPTLPELRDYDRFDEWQRAALDGGWGTRAGR